MDEQKQAYREEAYELLAELEGALLELEESPTDPDLVNQVFRALHTIKGSGAMFGFDPIARFTHEVETVFDRVREGRVPVSKELIRLALNARDQIRVMLDSDTDAMAESRTAQEIIAGLRAFLPAESKSPEPGPDESAEPDAPRLSAFLIEFVPERKILTNGTHPAFLFNELKGLGVEGEKSCRIQARTEAIPCLEEMDPEACYLSWRIELETYQPLNAVRDVFIFVEDQSRITIQPAKARANPEDASAASNPHRLLGEILVDAELIDPNTLETALKEQKEGQGVLAEKRSEEREGYSIRVASDKLDRLVDLVGELVTLQARLSQQAISRKETSLISIAEDMEMLTSELRDNTMSIRMLPIGMTFKRFRRLVHDLADELGKEVTMVTQGESTELDKTVIEQINDPLIHLIRNTIDHGIEPPEERLKKGKPRQGTIALSAEQSGSEVHIRIAGDGNGFDLEAIRQKAVDQKLIAEDAHLDEQEILSLIFAPGFSTAKHISGVSGRGVGMDVVKSRIEALGGSIAIENYREKGSAVILKLPLTLAIIDGLLVKVGQSHYVIPLTTVEECVELRRKEADLASRRNMMRVRDDLITFLRLREVFDVNGDSPAIERVVIVSEGGTFLGLGVDQVIGHHQTVIKGIGRFYRDVAGLSGATILGDGTVALILDIPQLLRSVEKEAAMRHAAHERSRGRNP